MRNDDIYRHWYSLSNSALVNSALVNSALVNVFLRDCDIHFQNRTFSFFKQLPLKMRKDSRCPDRFASTRPTTTVELLLCVYMCVRVCMLLLCINVCYDLAKLLRKISNLNCNIWNRIAKILFSSSSWTLILKVWLTEYHFVNIK